MNPTKQNWKLQRPTPTGLHIVTDDTLELPIATVFLPEGGGTASQRAERQAIAELICYAPGMRNALQALLKWAETDKHEDGGSFAHLAEVVIPLADEAVAKSADPYAPAHVASFAWHDASKEKPDTDTTVILGFADGETAHGYWCSETEFWRTTDALTAAGVRYWMQCPEVPKD